jgi:1,4-dihydroxy-2-naphthoyl-CoA synthase
MAETSLDPTRAAGDPDFVPPTPELLYERRGAVAFLTFNRPAARNAMTFAMYEGLYAACEHVDADDRVRVFVLRGAGDKAFVAGTDISQFQAFSTAADALDYEQKINRYLGRLEAVRKPTIAAIRGYCVGGGAVIALACDLRLASADARFGVPVARTLGNTLATQNVGRMVALLGDGLTKELLFTTRARPLGCTTRSCRPSGSRRARWSWPSRSRPTRRLPCARSRRPCGASASRDGWRAPTTWS